MTKRKTMHRPVIFYLVPLLEYNTELETLSVIKKTPRKIVCNDDKCIPEKILPVCKKKGLCQYDCIFFVCFFFSLEYLGKKNKSEKQIWQVR